MKKLKHIAIALMAVTYLTGCAGNKQKHLGEWKGKEGATALSLVLDKENHFTFVGDGEVIGGDNMDMGGKKIECKYEIDYTKSPIWLDFVFKDKASGEAHKWNGIVRFLTDKKIELRTNHMFDGARFDRFDAEDKSSTIILDKAE